MSMKRFSFDIDVLGACNLRCPSCPQGNIKDFHLPHGFMEPELLRRIIRKAQSECRIAGIGLFNWAEPLLHPELPELIRIVQAAGISCFLSSNLNINRNIEAIMAANPFSFRISLSGFTQQVYGYTHRGGDIEKVKRHMKELAEAKKRYKATTNIFVYYHRYRHNLKEEPLIKEFAARLGIGFEPVWALFFPLEKILAHAGEPSDVPITAEDMKLRERLALPLPESLEISGKYRNKPCPLKEKQISLDSKGNLQLCCGIFDSGKYTIGNYLEMPIDEIQRIRRDHGLCSVCTKHGAHVYLTYGTHELDETALKNISPEDCRLLDLRFELAQKRLRRYLESVYDTALSGIISTEQKAMVGRQFHRLQRLAGRARRLLSSRSRPQV
jgi:MoaA/NifB/PqqE/SkfB family radical SAM enzyme